MDCDHNWNQHCGSTTVWISRRNPYHTEFRNWTGLYTIYTATIFLIWLVHIPFSLTEIGLLWLLTYPQTSLWTLKIHIVIFLVRFKPEQVTFDALEELGQRPQLVDVIKYCMDEQSELLDQWKWSRPSLTSTRLTSLGGVKGPAIQSHI